MDFDLEKLAEKVGAMSATELLAFVCHLRRGVDRSEQEFLTTLTAIDRSGAWKKAALLGEPTFLQWLDSNHICKPARYANWAQATARVSFDVIDSIGIPAATKLGAIDNPEQRAEVQLLMLAAVSNNHGVPLSAQSARRKVEQVCGSVPGRKVTRVQELELELRAARTRIRELEHELKVTQDRFKRSCDEAMAS